MTILVGFLNTPAGRAALDRAADEAAVHHASLMLLVYMPPPLEGGTGARYGDERQAMEDRAESLAASLRERGIEVSIQVATGASSPSEAILDAAREHDVNLIVIGLRRRSRVGMLVVGSTAQEVLLGADAAVLGVRPPQE